MTIIPISEWDLSHRELKPISQGLTANTAQSQDLNPGLLSRSPHPLHHCAAHARGELEPGMPTRALCLAHSRYQEKQLHTKTVLGMASSSFPPNTHQTP